MHEHFTGLVELNRCFKCVLLFSFCPVLKACESIILRASGEQVGKIKTILVWEGSDFYVDKIVVNRKFSIQLDLKVYYRNSLKNDSRHVAPKYHIYDTNSKFYES